MNVSDQMRLRHAQKLLHVNVSIDIYLALPQSDKYYEVMERRREDIKNNYNQITTTVRQPSQGVPAAPGGFAVLASEAFGQAP